MKTISRPFIDELLARTDLVGLIHSRLPLKAKGSAHWACCPFHAENSPSFMVKDSHYHCFGCDKHGDALGFLMEFDHLAFPEAVEALADYNGVAVVYEDDGAATPQRTPLLEQGFQALARAADWFREQLLHPEIGRGARDYLRRRGLKMKTLNHWQLGYAPRGNQLLQALQGQFSPEVLLQTGLLGRNDDGQVYDWFRHRLIFPIHNRRGQIVGFGGRALDDQAKAKYLNSPETDWFSKRFELYGLHSARASRAAGLIVVEGYMDVVKMWQHGISGAVAALGTAFGDGHLAQLQRQRGRLHFCFDGDGAGRKAATRALDALFRHWKDEPSARFVFLPASEDPDSLLEKQGLDGLRAAFRGALTPSQFLLQLLDDGLGDRRHVEAQNRLLQQLGEWLAKLPAPAQHYRALLQGEALRHFGLPAELTLPSPDPAPTEALPPAEMAPARSRPARPPEPLARNQPLPEEKERKLLLALALNPALAADLHAYDYPAPQRQRFAHFWQMVSALQNSEDESQTIFHYRQLLQLDLQGAAAELYRHLSRAELESSLRASGRPFASG